MGGPRAKAGPSRSDDNLRALATSQTADTRQQRCFVGEVWIAKLLMLSWALLIPE